MLNKGVVFERVLYFSKMDFKQKSGTITQKVTLTKDQYRFTFFLPFTSFFLNIP